MFGCASMLNNPLSNSPNHNGNGYIRSGEYVDGEWTGGDTNMCNSFGLNGDSIGLGIRCCTFDDSKERSLPDNVALDANRPSQGMKHGMWWYPNYEKMGYCKASYVNEWQFELDQYWSMIGCTAWTGNTKSSLSSVTMSTQMIASMSVDALAMANSVHMGYGTRCYAQRGDAKGLIAGVGIGARIDGNGKYSCINQQAEGDADLVTSTSGVYKSVSTCPTGYNVVDCGYSMEGMGGTLEECAKANGGSYDLENVFGSVFVTNGCEAYGNSKRVRAQANCCKIVEGCMELCYAIDKCSAEYEC